MISVYENALSNPLTLEEARRAMEFIDAAVSVAILMRDISPDAELEGSEMAEWGVLLIALLSYPRQASDQISDEKRDAEGGES